MKKNDKKKIKTLTSVLAIFLVAIVIIVLVNNYLLISFNESRACAACGDYLYKFDLNKNCIIDGELDGNETGKTVAYWSSPEGNDEYMELGSSGHQGCLSCMAAGYQAGITIENCTLPTTTSITTTTYPIAGNDTDIHGCTGSTGSTWCEVKQRCLKAWEESCVNTTVTTSTHTTSTTLTTPPASNPLIYYGVWVIAFGVTIGALIYFGAKFLKQ